MSIGTRDLWRPSQRQVRALPKRIASNQCRPRLARPPSSAGGPWLCSIKRDKAKHSCTDTCWRRDSPPQIVLSGGDRDTGDGAQLGVSLAHARALVAPPSLCIFHTAFIRRRMVLALVQDWASSAAVPLMDFDGRPQGGGHLEPLARDSSGGCPGFIYPSGPGTFIRTALWSLRSSRPFADWTAVRTPLRCRSVVLERARSRASFVTHPVPPTCDQCLQTGGVSLAHARALVAPPVSLYFVSSIYCVYQKTHRRLPLRRRRL